jgi:hypothetical protein
MKKWQAALIVAAVLIGILAAGAIFQAFYTITNTGTIIGIGVTVYSDLECTHQLYSIAWGTFEPGQNKTVSAFIKNTNTTDVQVSMGTQEFTPPEAEAFLTLTWTYSNETLRPADVLPTNFTLSVAENVTSITNFTFKIVIQSREASS